MFTFSIEIFTLENHGMALVFYILLIEPSERFWTQTMIIKVFQCYVFLSRNLKELGVLWVWSKNLFNRKRGHERPVMKEP